MASTATEPRTFFSTLPELTMHPNAGRPTILTNGIRSTEREGEKIIEFTRWGDYGRIVTDDPEVIEFLEKQIASGRDDILTVEQYSDRITPDKVKADLAMAQNRTITDENRILKKRAADAEAQLAKLEAQLKAK